AIEAFREGLRERGWVEDETLTVNYRFTAGDVAPLPELAAELVRLQPEVLVGVTTPALRALKQATGAIPIVMAVTGARTGLGLIETGAPPGGNVPGLVGLSPERSANRLELLKDAPRGIRGVGFLYNGGVPDRAVDFGWTETAPRA